MSSMDHFISPEIRSLIEERYYTRINEQAQLENLIRDPTFLESRNRHPGFFSDHGVVHMRDVVQQHLDVLANVHGVLIPERPRWRYAWMQGYGVLLSCLHDIGMADFSGFGRAMHPEAAAQAVYGSQLEDVVEAIWQENSGNVAWRLLALADRGVLSQPPKIVLRELLSLSVCHSKSKVPMTVLNNPACLRDMLVKMLSTDLNYLYATQQAANNRQALTQALESDAEAALVSRLRSAVEEAETALRVLEDVIQDVGNRLNSDFFRFYNDATEEAFRWLISPEPALQALVLDAIDTVRLLRCADALRQRGTLLATSGGYEIFVDQRTANAIYAFRWGVDQLFLVEMPSWISAGEANIASSELEPSGDLRITFHRGQFTDIGAVQYAAKCAAIVISSMKGDIFDSFERPPDERATPNLITSADMHILLEETDDNPDFVIRVRTHLYAMLPDMAGRIDIVPSLVLASSAEHHLYVSGKPFDWDTDRRDALLTQLGRSGHLVEEMDPEQAFRHVKVVNLAAGQTLIEAGAPAGFVYVPLAPGLEVIPLRGHLSFSVQPWMPLGTTGVIRGATRNASVVATHDLQLLMIPKSIYLRHWHQTYSPETFERLVRSLRDYPEGQEQRGSRQ